MFDRESRNVGAKGKGREKGKREKRRKREREMSLRVTRADLHGKNIISEFGKTKAK